MKKGFKKILSFAQSLVLTATVGINGAFADSNASNKIANNHTPKVSVVIPVYKVEKYIGECLDSLLAQTIKKEDLEIICVNDGSPDNSLEILNQYAEKDKRIKVIDQKNSGVSAARNNGLKNATGKYVAFLDSDDYVDRNAYEIASDMADRQDADILCFGWRNFTDDGSKTSRKNCMPDYKIFTDWKAAKRERPSIFIWNKLYKREMLIKNNLTFCSNIKIAEDECFNLCAYPHAKKIVHIPYALYNYRVNPNGATKRMSFKSMISNYLNVWKQVNKFYETRGINFSLWNKVRYFTIYKEDFVAYVLPALGISR